MCLLFFNDNKKQQSFIENIFSTTSTNDVESFFNIPNVVDKVLMHHDNFTEQRRVMYENPEIMQFSPVMRYLRDFHAICDQKHEDPRLVAGRRG